MTIKNLIEKNLEKIAIASLLTFVLAASGFGIRCQYQNYCEQEQQRQQLKEHEKFPEEFKSYDNNKDGILSRTELEMYQRDKFWGTTPSRYRNEVKYQSYLVGERKWK